MSDVRVRFAPSPTGFFHIGGARTALFNWLYARHTGGAFVLRIEDTDTQRNTEEALRVLLEGMRWLGMDWDEGPDVGGAHGPYFQSQRTEIYREYLEKLRARERVYEREGAIYFRVEGKRKVVFDDYKKREVEKVDAAPQVIEDAVRGRVEKAVDEDFVIFRASGEPVFHFVNVVDDIAMGITHVIRGEDHLSNTPKHQELFQAFGAPFPVWAHIPLILKSTGPGKMSKRDKGALVEEYQQRHYIPAAVRNYLCLLGWNPKDDREIMEIGEIIARFDLDGINRGNARFDERKMAHFNAEYLRALPIETLAWMARPILQEAGLVTDDTPEDCVQAVLALCQEKLNGLEGLVDYTCYFFKDDFSVDEKALNKLRQKADPLALIEEMLPALEAVTDWTELNLVAAFNDLAEKHRRKVIDYFPALRLGVSGQGGGPHMLPTLVVLGRGRCLARLKKFHADLAARTS